MDLQWTIFVPRVGTDESIAVGTVERPVKGTTIADFGISISEGRRLLANLQQIVAHEPLGQRATVEAPTNAMVYQGCTLDADDLIKYNATGTGAGAHSDIYRLETVKAVWSFLDGRCDD